MKASGWDDAMSSHGMLAQFQFRIMDTTITILNSHDTMEWPPGICNADIPRSARLRYSDHIERATEAFRTANAWLKGGRSAPPPATNEIGRRMARDGLSFSEFLGFLERINLQTCDPHFAVQRHPLEDRLKPDYLVNVSRENLFDRLSEIEAELKLKPTALRDSFWVKRLRSHDRPALELGDCDGIYTRRLTCEAARKGPWPRNDALLTDDARRRIAALYAKDIACYCGGISTPAVSGILRPPD